jgi:hypothetical protein
MGDGRFGDGRGESAGPEGGVSDDEEEGGDAIDVAGDAIDVDDEDDEDDKHAADDNDGDDDDDDGDDDDDEDEDEGLGANDRRRADRRLL